MTPHLLFIIILIIIIAGYAFQLFLGWLNTTRWSNILPDSLKGIYDEEKYRRQQDYERVNYRFGLLTGALSFLAILAMLVFRGFAWIDGIIHSYSESPIVQALLFFGIIALASDLLSTPFDIYNTFKIEGKFGFNKTTPKTYLLDKLKGWILAVIIGGGLLSLIVYIYTRTGSWFWIVAWGSVTVFSIFINYFYTKIIVPLFNKLTPLEDGELRQAISSFANRINFNLKNIYVMDGSKRSTKGNAFFSGFGRQKKVILFDTLINEHNTDEMVGILAHEIGHYKKKHIVNGLISGILQTGAMFFLLSLLIGNPLLSQALGATKPSFHLGLITFGILYSPLSLLLGLLSNSISRKHEYQADYYAGIHHNPEALATALKKLSVKNLSNLTPHKAYVFFYYSHPPLLERLRAIDSISKA
jgi:STE24 endopeptidase